VVALPSFHRSTITLTLTLALALTAACGKTDRAAAGAADSATTAAATASTCPGDNAGLTLASGFCATVFADSVVHGRHVVVASNGDVYITND
jgi:hypothetical protein